MRMDIENKTFDEIFHQNFSSRTRRKIRKAQEYNFSFKKGNDTQLINHFYQIYSQTMLNHGTPVLDINLFYNLVNEFGNKIIFFNFFFNKPDSFNKRFLLFGNNTWSLS